MLMGAYINRACRALSKKDLPSRNVLGEVTGKIFKIGQDFKKPFSISKFNSHSFKKSHEKMSTLLNMREMQIKTSTRYHLTPVTMATGTYSTNNKCCRGCQCSEICGSNHSFMPIEKGIKEGESSYTDAGNGKWEQPLWRTLGRGK